MKRTLSILIVFLMLIPATTHAQVAVSSNTTELIDPGMTPDNFLYYLDVAMDNLALAATFNTDDKINKSLEIAEERLAEAKAMAEKGDYKAMEIAEEEHNKTISLLKGEVDDLQDTDQEKALEEKLKIEVKIKQYGDKLDEIDVKLKENFTEEQKSYFIALLQNFKNQTKGVELDIEDELNDSRDKLGEHAKELEHSIREKQGIDVFEKTRAEKMRAKAELKWTRVVEAAAEYNVTALDKTEFNALLAKGDALLANKSYEKAKDAYETAKDHAEDILDSIEESSKGEHGIGLKEANKMKFEAEAEWSEVMEKAIKSNIAVPDRKEFDALIAKGDAFLFQGSYEDAIEAYEKAMEYAEKMKESLAKGSGDLKKDD